MDSGQFMSSTSRSLSMTLIQCTLVPIGDSNSDQRRGDIVHNMPCWSANLVATSCDVVV